MNVIVCQWACPVLKLQACTARVTPPIRSPTQTVCCQRPWAKMLSVGGRGGRCITPRSVGSTDEGEPGEPVGHEVDPEDVDREERDGEPDEGRQEDRPDLAELLVSMYRTNLRMLS